MDLVYEALKAELLANELKIFFPQNEEPGR